MSKYLRILDIIFPVVLAVYSFSLVSFYLQGEFIGTGYEDWMVHAFRVKLLETFGFISWSHQWANGIDIWKAYQIIPHMITIGFMHLFDVSASKAMLFVTIFFFIFVRLTMYLSLRLLSFHPLTALFCSVASIDIAQFWGGVSDFSLMFGISFTPLMIYLWTQFSKGKLAYIFPFVVGLSFYLHPVLGYTVAILLVAGIFTSGQQIISIKTFMQFFILLATASLFWFPIITKEDYIYSSPFLTDQFFLNQVIKNYGHFGTSIFVLATIPLGLIGLIFNKKKGTSWATILYIFSIIYFLMVVIGINYPLPKAIAQFQFTRGVTIAAICFIFVFAIFVENFIRSKSNFIKALLMISLIPIVIESNIIIKEHAPNVTSYIPDPVSSYSNQSIDDAKIWTSSIGTASYFSPSTYQFPYSYMGHLDSNIVSPRIAQMIIYKNYPQGVPVASVARILEYFKITGTKYAFFYQDSAYVPALLNKDTSLGFIDLGFTRSYDTLFHVFQSPVQPVSAAVLSKESIENKYTFPTEIGIYTTKDQMLLDEHVEKFNKVIYNDKNMILDVAYPFNDTLTVTIPKNPISNSIYIAESYDVNWEGKIDGKAVEIEPIGPNYINVTLPPETNGGKLTLERKFPTYLFIFPYIIAVIGISVVLHALLTRRAVK